MKVKHLLCAASPQLSQYSPNPLSIQKCALESWLFQGSLSSLAGYSGSHCYQSQPVSQKREGPGPRHGSMCEWKH
ncbi:unnamed protein product [Staurois parvus]|uniref:Uncharacterized protein n=1 Tax=Staurois parvus TaxID=386267 RepID=A0ABN9FV86_9NEOB|nr:unnamed protein product [Staurois parvus]